MESEEKRKSSVEVEMEKYLEEELGKKTGEESSEHMDVVKTEPLDLTLPKKVEATIPKIFITDDLKSVQIKSDTNAVTDTKDIELTHDREPDAIQQQQHPEAQPGDAAQDPVEQTLVEPDPADKQQSDAEDTTQCSSSSLGSPREAVSDISVRFEDLRMTERPETRISPPSRIPSRKNSHPMSLSEDLKKLENKLEKYMPKAGSEAGSETSEVSDSSLRSNSSVSSVVNRLHNSQTASTRAKVADSCARSGGDLMTSSSRGRIPEVMTSSLRGRSDIHQKSMASSPPEKPGGTASMLKSTLRKMSRFGMASSKGKKEEEGTKEKVSPEVKSRNRPSTHKFNTINSAVVGRSKSFKEPEKPGLRRQNSGTKNHTYSSSLRRVKNKSQQDSSLDPGSQTHLQRTSTSGQLDRGGMRRSISASRGGGARVVKKSRTVQTQLTLDAGLEPDDQEPASNLNFQVWLPDLLGEDTDQVETHVETSSEPVDVRKNRQLTLENMKLQREVERLKAQINENEVLRKELKSVKQKLEEEQKSRVSIQKDLENNHERVRAIMTGMESVEREWENRGETLEQLQMDLNKAQEVEAELKNQLSSAGQTIQAQKREIDRSMAAQKTLIHQLQESEAEAKELQEFLQAEKSTLAEALRESEGEVSRLKSVISDKDDALGRLEEQSSLLVRRSEQRSQELQAARAEMNGMKERAREMLLAQGAELSRASLAVSQIYDRLEQMAPDLQAEERDDSESSESRSDQLELGQARRSSQFLVTPTENLDVLSEFSKAMMSASTGSDNLGEVGNSISNLASAIAERKHTEMVTQNGSTSVPSLADQITQLNFLFTKILSTYSLSNFSDNLNSNHNNVLENRFNVNTDTAFDIENIDLGNMEITRNIIQEQNRVLDQLRTMIREREQALAEMRNKFARNRQILTSNWQQAEEEVRKLDDIYHTTVTRVRNALEALPEVVGANPNLENLLKALHQAQQEEPPFSLADGINGNQRANLKSKSESLLTRSLINETLSSNGQGGVVNNMSQSLLIEAAVPVGMKTGVCSEPCLAKSPLGNIPSILSTPTTRFQEEDLNANQSL